jgi:inosine-uridine nucleoside N-ribohydrolase
MMKKYLFMLSKTLILGLLELVGIYHVSNAWALSIPQPHIEEVWIDTDPACGLGSTADPDDCFALVLALQEAGLHIRGISTVFGNTDVNKTTAVAETFIELWQSLSAEGNTPPPIYTGAERRRIRRDIPPAWDALETALETTPLRIIALGPLTNIAGVLHRRPELANRVSEIIAVAGQQPGHVFHPANADGGAMLFGHGVRFTDLNFRKDVDAFKTILQLQVPLTLLPYETAENVIVTSDDVKQLASGTPIARWLARQSQEWLNFWKTTFGRDGFFPFDSLAVGYAIAPDQFTCELLPVTISYRHLVNIVPIYLELRVSPRIDSDWRARYCAEVNTNFNDWLIERLVNAKP